MSSLLHSSTTAGITSRAYGSGLLTPAETLTHQGARRTPLTSNDYDDPITILPTSHAYANLRLTYRPQHRPMNLHIPILDSLPNRLCADARS